MSPSAPPLLVLLPPSEGKAVGGDGPPWSPDSGAFGTGLGSCRDEVIDALDAVGGGDARLLEVTGSHLDRAVSANRSVLGAGTLPAWRRYTGVVWQHLDPASLPTARRRRIVVVSGLLGLVRGDDPVPDYRLKMGASLPPLGKLSTWWRPMISETLARRARRSVVIDLLPVEHRLAWEPTRNTTGAAVTLRTPTGTSGGHAAKAAKGLLARHLMLSDQHPLDALTQWQHPDFQLEVTDLGGPH